MKIIAFRFSSYFHSFWNRVDLTNALCSFLVVLSNNNWRFLNLRIINFLNSFKIILIIKIAKKMNSTKKLFNTLKFSFPMIINVLSLVLLNMFVFSIIGCELFGDIDNFEDFSTLDEYINFKNFLYSFMTLLKISTNDDWANIMFEVIKIKKGFSFLYFITFIILNTFIMMNLFILILLNQFEEFYFNSDNPLYSF